MKAASEPSTLSSSVIEERNWALDKQLSLKHLRTIDVRGDGNCLLRALSVGLYGHEEEHKNLRKSIANYMISMNMSSNIINDGVWIGEDGIIAAAMFLSREIHVFLWLLTEYRP